MKKDENMIEFCSGSRTFIAKREKYKWVMQQTCLQMPRKT